MGRKPAASFQEPSLHGGGEEGPARPWGLRRSVTQKGLGRQEPRSKSHGRERKLEGNGAIQETCPWTLGCGRGGDNSEEVTVTERRQRGQLGNKLGKGWQRGAGLSGKHPCAAQSLKPGKSGDLQTTPEPRTALHSSWPPRWAQGPSPRRTAASLRQGGCPGPGRQSGGQGAGPGLQP